MFFYTILRIFTTLYERKVGTRLSKMLNLSLMIGHLYLVHRVDLELPQQLN
jgi:hypothetical protein